MFDRSMDSVAEIVMSSEKGLKLGPAANSHHPDRLPPIKSQIESKSDSTMAIALPKWKSSRSDFRA